MRRLRRHDLSPRVEMMPLIDIVFLLLTFFIYAMVVMVELKTTGLALGSVEGGNRIENRSLVVVEIDLDGSVAIDRVPLRDDELDAAFSELAHRADRPQVILAMVEGEGRVDRGPIYERLLARMDRAGIHRINLPEFGGAGN